jgi:hypothetical protein
VALFFAQKLGAHSIFLHPIKPVNNSVFILECKNIAYFCFFVVQSGVKWGSTT